MVEEFWFILGVVVFVALMIVVGVKGWKDRRVGSSFASLAAYHDLQPKDKQDAIEVVIEQKAGKKLEEQESGQNKNPKSQLPGLEPRGK